MSSVLQPSSLRSRDLLRVAAVGLRTRKLRAALSALGIMIGIGAMVGVLGLSDSSRSELLEQLDRLGTNLLTVEATTGIGRGTGELADEAADMISRIAPVETTTAATAIPDTSVYRTDLVPSSQTGGVSVVAVDDNLLTTLGGSIAAGRFLDEAPAGYPVVVLGSVAAERLGIREATGDHMIWLGDQWFTVVGILDTFEVNPDLDRAALVSHETAANYLGAADLAPTSVYTRTHPDHVETVMTVLAATANPEAPEEVAVNRPTDALVAREAAEDALTALFLGLGAVALLVGGVGIANVMVISVLERRSEIGLRRALGATRRQIASQFLGEALILSAVGGLGGVILGSAVTAGYAAIRGWATLIPQVAIVGGIAAAVVIGAIAGLYPAIRASRMSPTEALRTA